jgi:hypothetical protein
MSSELEQLGMRRQLLVARARVQRLEAAGEIAVLRARLRAPLSGTALLSNAHVRSALFAAVAFALGRTRFARTLRAAAFALAAVRILRAASAARD